MGAPVAALAPWSTGSFFKLPDGFSTQISIASEPTIGLWERAITPPAWDGGEPIDTTTMRNKTWRTKHARHLISMGNMTIQCAYDPNVLNSIQTMLNVGTTITIFFPPSHEGTTVGDTLAFFGYLQKFEQEALKEGELPLANVTIAVTNQDSTSAEQSPVWTTGTGTS